MATATVGGYLIERLMELGVRHVFGIPGDYVLGFYERLEHSALSVINCADEQGAGYAADAYARVNGIVPWHYERIPEVLGAGRGYDVRTEGDLDAALATARVDRGQFSLLRVHLDAHDMSPALRRLTALLAERVKPGSPSGG